MYKILLVIPRRSMTLATIKFSSATTGLIATSRQNVEHRKMKRIVTCSHKADKNPIPSTTYNYVLRVGTHKTQSEKIHDVSVQRSIAGTHVTQ